MGRSTREQDEERRREAERVLDRVSADAEVFGGSTLGRAASRVSPIPSSALPRLRSASGASGLPG